MTHRQKHPDAQVEAFMAEVEREGNAYVMDADDGEFIIDGVVNVRAALQRALTTPTPGVRTVDFRGMLIVIHPDFPPHAWDGKTMHRVYMGFDTADASFARSFSGERT